MRPGTHWVGTFLSSLNLNAYGTVRVTCTDGVDITLSLRYDGEYRCGEEEIGVKVADMRTGYTFYLSSCKYEPIRACVMKITETSRSGTYKFPDDLDSGSFTIATRESPHNHCSRRISTRTDSSAA